MVDVYRNLLLYSRLKGELTRKTIFLYNAENDAWNLNFKLSVNYYCPF